MPAHGDVARDREARVRAALDAAGAEEGALACVWLAVAAFGVVLWSALQPVLALSGYYYFLGHALLTAAFLAGGLCKFNSHDILAVGRQVTANSRASSRTQRQPIEMGILDQIPVKLVTVNYWRHRCVTDCESTDLPRRGEITFKSSRRHK